MLRVMNTQIDKLGSKELCEQGEYLAKKFLKKNGYKILERNYTTRYGEIDIIAFDKGVISFVEVKTRQSDIFGAPELAITNKKRSRIVRTALKYIIVNKIEDVDYRFDVVSILFKKDSKKPDIGLLKNAFTADGVLK